MLLYLPCNRFRVRYILSTGMPYSKLDRLILRSVRDGIYTVENLSEIFKLNNNVLIQSLVTLIQAGWLTLGNSAEVQFSLTKQGIMALDTKQTPKSIIYRQETAEILLEQVSGCLIPRGEVIYRNFRDLNINEPWDNPQVLRKEITKKAPEQGEVQDLLPMRLGERLHWVQDIQKVSRDFECVPLDVDLENEKIVNFPSHRSLFLHEKIIGYAKVFQQRQGGNLQFGKKKDLPLIQKTGRESAFALPRDTYEINWSPDNILISSQEMLTSLISCIEQAHKYLLIVSRVMSKSNILQIEAPLLQAIKRGVKISLLWGRNADQESLDYLGKLTYKVEQENLPGQLSYNIEPCKFNSSLVLFDKDKLEFDAIVGNCNWLSLSRENITEPEIGFRISHPEIIASMARIIGGYASDMDSNSMQEVANQWKRIAADISSSTMDIYNNYSTGRNEPIKVRLVQSASDHLDALLELTTLPTQRFYILSTSMDSAGRRRIEGNSNFLNSEVKSVAIVGVSDENVNSSKTYDVNSLYERENINTNIMATEKAVCITSYPPLLGMDMVRTDRNLGIVVYGEEFAEAIMDKIENLFFTEN